jgi:hypothetical protein
MEKKKEVTDRIPFDVWINSQLSIAKYVGIIDINGKKYMFDPDYIWEDENNGKPDLVTYD